MKNKSLRVLSAVLSILIVSLSVTACSKKANKPIKTTTETTTVTETTTTQPETTTTIPKTVHTIEGQVPESARVDSTYFDDAVFVGDSISDMLKYYESSNDKLGKAQFLTAGSLSATNALWDVSYSKSVFPKYNGQKMKLEASVPLTGARKIYIMLGMNDISMGADGAIANYSKVLKAIMKNCPNSILYVESVTPRVDIPAAHTSKLTNETITDYNKRLSKMCKENGWYFLNVAEVMFDSKGFLKEEYCSDKSSMGMHFTYEGCSKWVEYLYTHTIEVKELTTTEVTSSSTSAQTTTSAKSTAKETTTSVTEKNNTTTILETTTLKTN